MEGAARRAKAEHEAQIAQAWHMAAFNAASKSKKGLQPLAKYLGIRAPKKEQTPEEMLEILRTIGGGKMSIKQVN